jgi:AcrR family transcriptional regulator
MGTASSALYRYFPSQGDLVTALCVEAYDSLAEALAAARDAQPSGDHARRWAALCHAYRRWSLQHPSDFALIFGTPLPGYQAPPQATATAAGRSLAIVAQVYAAAVQAGAADPGRAQVPAGLQTGALWAALASDSTPVGEPALAGIVLAAWCSLLGYLVAEIFGSLTQLITSTDLLYQAHVRTVMGGMGFQAVPIDPAAT